MLIVVVRVPVHGYRICTLIHLQRHNLDIYTKVVFISLAKEQFSN